MKTKLFPVNEKVDTHCHLNDRAFDADRDQIIRECGASLDWIIDVGVDVGSSQRAVENAAKYKGKVFATVGLDPERLIPGSEIYSTLDWDEDMTKIKDLAENNRDQVVAIGEIGIDSYWLHKSFAAGEITRNEMEQSLQKQMEMFKEQLQLAITLDLPVSVHSRAAEKQCLEIVKRYPAARGIFHSYTGDYPTARQILDAGWGLGVNGIISFPNAGDLRHLYRGILGDVPQGNDTMGYLYSHGVYLETDAPYLAPQDHRGERNIPCYVEHVLKILRNLN